MPQVTFRNFPESEAVREAVQKNLDRLERFFPRITGCHVVLEAAQQNHHRVHDYHVVIEMCVPGHKIVVSHNHGIRESHQDIYVTIRDAFSAATRQLEDYVRERRGQVKHHEALPRESSGL